MIPELENRIIATGNQVVFGVLLPQKAMEVMAEDQELTNLPDEVLRSYIEETDRYWREKMSAAVRHPENVIIYPVLMVVCAESRLKAIGAFRASAAAGIKAPLDSRMAHWITLTARCFLAKGEALLLAPDPKTAWETFTQANLMARAMPDFGQLRLRETLFACYGQISAASLGNQTGLVQQAQAEFDGLTTIPDRLEEAQGYLQEIRSEFDPIRSVFQERLALLKGPAVREESAQEPPKDNADAYAIYYMEQLNWFGGHVFKGIMGLDEAKQGLLQKIDVSLLGTSKVYFVSLLHRRLVDSAPDRAVILAELNYAVSSTLPGDLAELTRAYCAEALAMALTALARQQGNDAGYYRRAIPYYEEALAILDRDGTVEATNEAANIMTRLVTCYRGIGEMERATVLSHDAIKRLQSLPEQRVNLGVAYGNLADVQQQTGNPHAAFENHYNALKIFTEQKDIPHSRQALFYLSRSGEQVGRLDDVLAAAVLAADLMVELADREGAVTVYLLQAKHLFRTRRFEEALQVLIRAEDILLPGVTPDHRDEKTLRLYYDLLLWRSVFVTLLLKEPSGRYTLDMAQAPLEEALGIAEEIKDQDLRANALEQCAALFSEAGELDQAEDYCKKIETIPSSPMYRTRYADILGVIRYKQKRYGEATTLLQQAVDGYGMEYRDKQMVARSYLAEVQLAQGLLQEAAQSLTSALNTFEESRLALFEESRMEIMGNAVELYDRLIDLYGSPDSPIANPERAFYWLERSKSRVFVEALAFTSIPCWNAPDSVRGDLADEKQLLDRANNLRSRLFMSEHNEANRLGVQQELSSCLQHLNDIYARIAPHCPDYVLLRQGAVAGSQTLQQLLGGERR